MSKQTFDFSEALKRMRQGKKVIRREARHTFSYVELRKDCFYVKRKAREDGLPMTFLTQRDILATDWEEVEG